MAYRQIYEAHSPFDFLKLFILIMILIYNNWLFFMGRYTDQKCCTMKVHLNEMKYIDIFIVLKKLKNNSGSGVLCFGKRQSVGKFPGRWSYWIQWISQTSFIWLTKLYRLETSSCRLRQATSTFLHNFIKATVILFPGTFFYHTFSST